MATIRQRGNSYQIRVSAGYDATGKQIMKMMTWKPADGMTTKQIEKKLNQVAVDFENKVQNGQYLDGNIKFSEFAEKWFTDFADKQLSVSTIASYRVYLKRINTAIGHIRLDKLQPNHLIEFYNNLSEEGIRGDKKYSTKIDLSKLLKANQLTKKDLAQKAGITQNTVTFACRGNNMAEKSAKAICKALGIKLSETFIEHESGKLTGNTLLHYHHVISSILTSAVQWQVITANPAERVKPPRKQNKESGYLDVEESRLLVELLNNEPIQYRTAIILLLYSGMRRGELCGLEWPDFDFDNCTVSISRTSQYISGSGIITKGTKNTSSVRTIRIPGVTFALLREYRKWQNEERLKVGDQWHATDRLFTSWNGKPISPNTLTQWFRGFVKRSGLPPIHIHSLRHTNATMLITAGEDVRTVSGRLGHSQTSTTLNIYSHVIQSADARASQTLENILDPLKKKE